MVITKATTTTMYFHDFHYYTGSHQYKMSNYFEKKVSNRLDGLGCCASRGLVLYFVDSTKSCLGFVAAAEFKPTTISQQLSLSLFSHSFPSLQYLYYLHLIFSTEAQQLPDQNILGCCTKCKTKDKARRTMKRTETGSGFLVAVSGGGVGDRGGDSGRDHYP